MSAQRKRSSEESSVIDLDAPCSDPPTKKRSVQKKTVEKWVVENDKELNTSVWLKSETAADDRDRVATLKCAVCSRFRERFQPMRNPFFKKAQSSGPCEYASIARALSSMDAASTTKIKRKFKTAYVIALLYIDC